MHPREFIEKNIKQLLIKDGFSNRAVQDGVKEALQHFDRTAIFPKGRVFDECFATAKKTAKQIKKQEDKLNKK